MPPTGHVFGKSTRKEFCYDNLHISRNAWDTNLVKVRRRRRHPPPTPKLSHSILTHVSPPGEPRLPLGELGVQRWRRLCCYPPQREGQGTRPNTAVPRPHRSRSRHRLVHLPSSKSDSPPLPANTKPGTPSTTASLPRHPTTERSLSGKYHRTLLSTPIRVTRFKTSLRPSNLPATRGRHTTKLALSPLLTPCSEKSDRSSSTPRPKTSLPRLRATSRSSCGTLAPASLSCRSSTPTSYRVFRGAPMAP